MLNSRMLKISIGGNVKVTNWQQQQISWAELAERFRTPIRGTETLEQYMKFSKSKQNMEKDVGGFVGGALKGGQRKASTVASRDLITLDLDNIPAGATENILARVAGLGVGSVVYSTRKHSPVNPRLRVVLPLDRSVSPDEYEPIARKVAEMIGIEYADTTTYQASRLMFFPSASSDGEYVYVVNDAPFLWADGVLNLYKNWMDFKEWARGSEEEVKHTNHLAKQEDPRDKIGAVGDFCRAYDIHEAIETFLSDRYTPTDDPNRYSYVEGSTFGGAVVYEDGRFLFSHHSTDPCSSQTVNSYDLVRLHKFGEEDAEVKDGTIASKYPSAMRMRELINNDAIISRTKNKEIYLSMPKPSAAVDFDIEVVDAEFSSSDNLPEVVSEDWEWMDNLKKNGQTGKFEFTIGNIQTMLTHDPILKGKIRKDSFSNKVVGFCPLPWAPRREGKDQFNWTDKDDNGLAAYIEELLGSFQKEKFLIALSNCTEEHAFHPLQTYLKGLKWDGVKRLDTIFIDYLGAEDSEYVRTVARLTFTAAVYRAMVPGYKHDEMPILNGKQGGGKTTLIKKMGRQWFTNSLGDVENKDTVQALHGKWIIEMGELDSMNKSDAEAIKHFLSKDEDDIRLPYARNVENFKRSCIFFGTSNKTEYLKDPSGNRRFYPIDLDKTPITKGIHDDTPINGISLCDEVDQLWAEAFNNYENKMSTVMRGTALEEARRQQESHTEQHQWQEDIVEFVNAKVPTGWSTYSLEDRLKHWSNADNVNDFTVLEDRERICGKEVWVELLKGDMKTFKGNDAKTIHTILSKIEGFEVVNGSIYYGKVYNTRRNGIVRTGATE